MVSSFSVSSSSSFSTRTTSSKAAPARDHSRRTVAPATQDARLVQLAARTRRHIRWPRILRDADPTAAQWKWLENERNFSVYTKQDASVSKHHFAVLAIGVVKGSVPELASLLVTNSQAEYVRKMEALYGKSFKHGMYVNDVVVPPEDKDAYDADSDSMAAPAQLSVRTATFDKLGGWLARNDEWCFLEATSYDRERQVLEKLITTLAPQDAFAADRGSLSSSSLAGGSGSAKLFSDVTAAFRVEPDQSETSEVPPGVEDTRDSSRTEAEAKPRVATRVHFYADYCPGASSARESISARFGRFVSPRSANATSERVVKQRLVLLAKSCDRLSHLVRRRRLGMQLVVDQKRFLHAGSASCFCCDKRLGVLVAKVCRICGQGVCSDCSAKYERECHTRRGRTDRVRLEDVRVCDPCLARVDSADYSGISDAALAGPGVVPNPEGAKPAAADLKELLHDALLQAPSPSRKDAVLSVIRCVLDQERASEPTPPTTPSPQAVPPPRKLQDDPKPRGILLTPESNDNDYVDALDYLDLETVAHTEATLANEEGRPYPIDSRKGSPEEQMAYPMPANEAQRLEAIAHTQALGHGTYPELDIICDIAAKEMGSFASLVSIITADEQRVIGANMDWLRELVIKREDAFCAHAIMGTAPLEVPHPEADIRFSKIVPVTALGARYYCGFPIVADDAHGSVIGSLCVIDNKANELTESQYAVLRKLAATASKVVRIEGAKRRSSSLSSAPASPTRRETREP